MKIKHFIDDISFQSLIFLKFCKHREYKKKKINLIVELLKFISNKKNIEWSCSLKIQPSLLLNFVQSLIILGLKKFRVVTHFFWGKKIIKFLNFIYNNDFFFRLGWSCDHPDSNAEPPVLLYTIYKRIPFFQLDYYVIQKYPN